MVGRRDIIHPVVDLERVGRQRWRYWNGNNRGRCLLLVLVVVKIWVIRRVVGHGVVAAHASNDVVGAPLPKARVVASHKNAPLDGACK